MWLSVPAETTVIGRVVLYYHPPPPLMSKSPDPSAVSTAHSFNKILNQYKTASKARSATDMEDATKKLRRLILVDGIPSTVVCCTPWRVNESSQLDITGSYTTTKDMENLTSRTRHICTRFPRVCWSRALRGSRKDKERYVQVRFAAFLACFSELKFA